MPSAYNLSNSVNSDIFKLVFPKTFSVPRGLKRNRITEFRCPSVCLSVHDIMIKCLRYTSTFDNIRQLYRLYTPRYTVYLNKITSRL